MPRRRRTEMVIFRHFKGFMKKQRQISVLSPTIATAVFWLLIKGPERERASENAEGLQPARYAGITESVFSGRCK